MTSLCRTLASTILLTAAFLPPGASGQDTLALRDGGHTEISTETMAVLSFRGLDVAPEALARVARLPDGGFGVTSRVFSGTVRLFSAGGTYLGSFGRDGRGPGEFGGTLFGASNAEYLWLVDGANQRIAVLDSALHVVAERSLNGLVVSVTPSRISGGVLASGRFVREGAPASMVWLAIEDESDRFGPPAAPSGDGNARQGLRLATDTSEGEVWSFAMMGGAISILDAESLALLESRSLGKAFQEVPPAGRLALERQPPPAQVGGVMSHKDHLWVLVMVPDLQWEPGLTLADGAARFYDTLILRIDSRERRIAGRARLDAVCFPIQDSLVSCVDETNEQIAIVRLNPTLVQSPSRDPGAVVGRR
jgi:hypothetical protein